MVFVKQLIKEKDIVIIVGNDLLDNDSIQYKQSNMRTTKKENNYTNAVANSLILSAVAEIIQKLHDIEDNTRK